MNLGPKDRKQLWGLAVIDLCAHNLGFEAIADPPGERAQRLVVRQLHLGRAIFKNTVQ